MRYYPTLLALTLFFTQIQAIPSAPSTENGRIAFIINKDAITKNALDFRLKLAAASSGMDFTPEDLERIRPQIQQAMIHEALQLQEAKKEGIDVPQKDIDEAIEHLEQSSGMTKGAIGKLLKDNNIPRSTLEGQVRAHLSWLAVIRARHSQSFHVTEDDVDQELKRQKDQQNKHRFHLAEIVLSAETPQQERESLSTMKQLIHQLQEGAHWGALAQQFSESATAAKGGDMGWVSADNLMPEVKEVLSHMTPGDISQPFKVGNTYMLMAMVDEKKPGQNGKVLISMAQGFIPYPFFASNDEKQSIRSAAKKISTTSGSCPAFEKAIKAQGGEAKNSGKVLLNQMAPELISAIENLKPGQSVEPAPTEDGVMMMMLCERVEEKEKEWTREDIFNTLVSRRLELLAKRELRDAKRSAFIDVRI